MQLSLRLKEPQITRLDNLAKRTGRSKTFYVTEAIDRYLDELEEIYLAEQVLTDVRSGKMKTVSWEELKKRNEL
jgi:RHH-type rel operon transcriptional repressor/antitoxin RelB